MGYQRDRPVFERFSVAVDPVGIVQIAGANGTGKSTFMEAASGYLSPWQGSVLVGGDAASSHQARSRRRVCRSREALYPSMTVRDHLTFAARSSGSDPAQAHMRAEAYGMGQWLESAATSLSTGNRRKLWLVMCTTGPFETVLLDEPFDGLDRHGIETLHDEVVRWGKDRCVMIASHSLPTQISFSAVIHLDANIALEARS